MHFETPPCLILKEDIYSIEFSKKDVLNDTKQKKLRHHHLNRAAQLGNLLKNKVNIYFKDKESNLMRVNTTIWAVTKDFVVLKKGTVIPLKSIMHID